MVGRWLKAFSLAVLCAVCLAACSTAAVPHTASSHSVARDSPATAPSSRVAPVESQEPAGLTERPDGKPIAEGLPFKDMDEGLIDQTWLGMHDKVGDPIEGGLFDGGVTYTWLAQNGTGDAVFSAIVVDGRVVKVDKCNMGCNYWAVPGKILSRELPDRTASGAWVDTGATTPQPEDPTDYDSPEEYADNNEGVFAANGASDPWQSAYDYWYGNAG